MIISERLCAIREIRDVEIDEGQPSMKNLKEFTQAFSTAACYYQAKNLSIWHLTNDFVFYTLPKNCESCTCKIPAKSTTTNLSKVFLL